MSFSRATEAKVGLFTVIGLAVLILGIMWGKQISLQAGAQHVSLHFPQSGGLIEGDPVAVSGVKCGRVQKVDLDATGVIVTAALERRVDLHADATAMILMLELMGGKKIDITPGTSPTMLPEGGVINGVTAMDIPAAVSQLGLLSGDVTRILFRLDTALASINTLLTDRQMLEAIRHAIVSLDATATMVQSFVARNQGNLDSTIRNAKILVSDARDFFQTNRPAIEKLIKSADKTVVSVDATIMHADSTISTLNAILEEIKKGEGSAHKLIYDKDLAAKIDSTITRAHNLVNFILDHGVNVNLRLGTRP